MVYIFFFNSNIDNEVWLKLNIKVSSWGLTVLEITILTSPLWWKIEEEKIVGMLILIAQEKGFDALNTTQITPALCEVPFLKK